MPAMRQWPFIAFVTLALGVLSGAAAYQQVGPRQDQRHAEWREIAWPFPRDGWPAGKAFRCDTAACGHDVAIYVRPKMGFCNCDRGVAGEVVISSLPSRTATATRPRCGARRWRFLRRVR
jgi:hypothetical protein